MNKNIIFLFFIIPAILAACNNSSKDSGNKSDTADKSLQHDGMDHGTVKNIAVPVMPAVPAGARVFFKNLKEGAQISSPFKIEMGVEYIKVDTAGPVVAGSGHHHLFINGADSLLEGTVVPADSSHIHFGKGQTEYELSLKPGKYKFTLQFADGLHRSYGGRMAATVNVTVK